MYNMSKPLQKVCWSIANFHRKIEAVALCRNENLRLTLSFLITTNLESKHY